MLGGRGVLRRLKNRRILSKQFRRNGSINNLEGAPTSFLNDVPLFALALFGLAFGYCAGVKASFLCLTFYGGLKRYGVFDAIQHNVRVYRQRRQQHGPTLRQKCYYYVDYWLSTNPYAKALVLMALTMSLVVTSGTIISYMASEPWIESLWAAALGSGLDWGFVNSNSPSLRFVAVCTNVGGLVLTALLLSIISDAVQTKYDSLRKGESFVTETGHTLIIGWSVKSLSVMIQLAKAGESNGSNVLVCLSDKREKEDMENDIAQCDFNFATVGTRVVCRSGSPLSHHDLRRVSFFRARSIIILGDDEHDAENNDARSLQILLSIVAALEREKQTAEKQTNAGEILSFSGDVQVPRPDRVVIEVMDTENAAIMTSVCPELVEPVLAHDVLGRLMLQAARNPLVADVWQELLGFDGCETYSGQWGILRGLCFKDVLLCFEDAIPLGVKTGNGELLLNPDDGYVIAEGDEIIVLAEDDDTYHASLTHSLIREAVPCPESPSGIRYVDICSGGLAAIRTFSQKWSRSSTANFPDTSDRDNEQEKERILFCGWRFDMGNLLQVYSAVAPPGSEFWILSELPIEQRESELQLRGWESNGKVKVVHRVGASRRNVLAQLPLETFSSVIVGNSEAGSSETGNSRHPLGSSESSARSKSEAVGDADARVITVVMMIQDITMRRNGPDDNEFGSPVSADRRDASSFGSGQFSRFMSSPRQDGCAPLVSNHSGLARARSQRFLGSKPDAVCNYSRGVIVGEIVDSRSRAMLSVVNSIDAVVASSELISKAVAMVSEDGSVNKVLNTLFDPYDSEITLETIESYVDVKENEKVSFFELMARGRVVGTIVLGYLERELIPSETDEGSTIRYTDVALNPGKKDIRRGWHQDDLLIVLTPGTKGSSIAPSDFLSDIDDIRTLDMGREVSWMAGGDAVSFGKRAKVRFRN